MEYETLPDEIDTLEKEIADLNQCLSEPECYKKRGIVTIGEELEKLKNVLENKIERYLELEEKVESFDR